MRTHWVTGLATATLLLALAPDADARPFRPGFLPNGAENNCSNCHVSAGGGGARTTFGEDVLANVTANGMEDFWAAVCALDSDGDGLTNGEELGDPCCVWTLNSDPARTDGISLPGDDTSVSATPSAPDDNGNGISNGCDPDFMPGEDMGMGGDDMGMGGDDMGMPANNTPGNNTTGNNTPNNNNNVPDNNAPNNTPGNNASPDMGDPGPDPAMTNDDEGCGCASAPTTTATPWLLAFALLFSRVRRRRVKR